VNWWEAGFAVSGTHSGVFFVLVLIGLVKWLRESRAAAPSSVAVTA
jgi:hypothetical protein